MLVELVGIPGSGKTTLYRHMSEAMKRRGLLFTDINEISNRPPQPKSTPRFVTAKPKRAPLYKYIQFSRKHPELVHQTSELFGDESIKHFLYCLLASSFQSAVDIKRENEIVVMDEGFLSHSVAACFGNESSHILEKIITLSPAFDAIIFINTPPEIAFERAVNRVGGSEKMMKKIITKFGDLSAFQKRKTALLKGIEFYRKKCGGVIEVDPSQDLKQSAEYIVDELHKINLGRPSCSAAS
jgi:thymidylate kinase